MNEELKPCPFCGGKVNYTHNMELIPDGIACMHCWTVTRFIRIRPKKRETFGETMKKMSEIWNRRERRWNE